MARSEETRSVRSFMLRSGRMTRHQRLALDEYWPRYGLEEQGTLDLDRIFPRKVPRFMEIGFGMGETLVEMAAAHRDRDYLGVEVYSPGIGRLLGRLAALEIPNVRVLRADACEVLAKRLADHSLDEVWLWFPDPWPKKRHHKRRLVQPYFVSLVAAKLKAGGRFLLATDWEDYAWHMLKTLKEEPRLVNLAPQGGFSGRPLERPVTKFEIRGRRLGHPVWDLMFGKQQGDVSSLPGR